MGGKSWVLAYEKEIERAASLSTSATEVAVITEKGSSDKRRF